VRLEALPASPDRLLDAIVARRRADRRHRAAAPAVTGAD